MRSHPNKAVDIVVCQTFQILLVFAPSMHVCSWVPPSAKITPLGFHVSWFCSPQTFRQPPPALS
jgi:hypothetical protein